MPKLPHRATPSIKFPIKFIVGVKCLAQEHNAVFLARAQTQTALSRNERINLEATMPPTPIHSSSTILGFVGYLVTR